MARGIGGIIAAVLVLVGILVLFAIGIVMTGQAGFDIKNTTSTDTFERATAENMTEIAVPVMDWGGQFAFYFAVSLVFLTVFLFLYGAGRRRR